MKGFAQEPTAEGLCGTTICFKLQLRQQIIFLGSKGCGGCCNSKDGKEKEKDSHDCTPEAKEVCCEDIEDLSCALKKR